MSFINLLINRLIFIGITQVLPWNYRHVLGGHLSWAHPDTVKKSERTRHKSHNDTLHAGTEFPTHDYGWRREANSVSRMRESIRTITKLAHFWSDIRWFPRLCLHYTPLHDINRAGERVSNATMPISPPGDHSMACGVWRHMPVCLLS